MDRTRNHRKGRPAVVLAQLFGIALCIMTLIWTIHYLGGLDLDAANSFHIFNVHPTLMIIGFIFLTSQAIMVYATVPVKRKKQKLTHLTLLGIAIVLGCVGIYAAFKYHKRANLPNFYSLHSWMGIGTICLFGFQWIVGFITFMVRGTPATTREKVLPYHVFFGMFMYALAIATALAGLLEKITFQEVIGGLGRYSHTAKLGNFIGVFLILHGMLVVLALVLSYSRPWSL